MSARRRLVRGLACGAALWVLVLGAERVLDLARPYPMPALERHGRSTVVRAADGTVLRVTPTRHGERLIRVPLSKVSRHVKNALLAAEDGRFYRHSGVDWLAAVRAAATSAVRGRVVSGASTLTMQLVRIVEPRRRTLVAKLREMLRARQLERRLGKDEILAHYVNLVPLGGTLRGFEAGARYWFGKGAADLTAPEAATLVAMLPAPSRRSPARRPELVRFHRDRVLDRMRGAGFLSEREHSAARSAPLGTRRHPWPFLAPHACEHLLRAHRGPEIASTIDLGLQARIERAVSMRDDAGADGVAVVVLDRRTGRLRALVGSDDYRVRMLDASRCPRPAGSTLKPFLYALALQLGAIGIDRPIEDAALEFRRWTPANFDQEVLGVMRAGTALARSRNLPAVRLLRAVGVDRFRDVLGELGIGTASGALHLDAALGTCSVSALALARAYQRFASDRPRVAGLDLSTRQRVLAALADASPFPDVLRDGSIAWKTGTSSGRRDAWCAGVTQSLVVVVWLGNLGGRGAPDLVGGRAATRLLGTIVRG